MKNKKTFLILVVLFVISLVYTHFAESGKKINPEKESENLAVTFLNVGQGDSSFVEFPNGKCMLIDASTPGEGEKISNHIAAKGYSKIDYIVATHPHNDHIGGMKYVTDCFEIGSVYMPDAAGTSDTYLSLLKAFKRLGTNVVKAEGGVEFAEGDVKVEFLSPLRDEYEELNDYSAVVKITYHKKSFLFTGDAEELVETDILESGADIKAHVLKVGHHGSSSSTSDAFLEAVSPEIAVISCGKDNDYGHPHKEILNRLEEADVKLYRTDVNGDVTLVSNGQEVANYYDLYN